MKLLNLKPTLILSENEFHALEVVDELLGNLECEDCNAVDALLDDAGWSYCDIENLHGLLQAIVDEGMVTGSASAKALVVEYTAELVMG